MMTTGGRREEAREEAREESEKGREKGREEDKHPFVVWIIVLAATLVD